MLFFTPTFRLKTQESGLPCSHKMQNGDTKAKIQLKTCGNLKGQGILTNDAVHLSSYKQI